jgi:hypothetical protein
MNRLHPRPARLICLAVILAFAAPVVAQPARTEMPKPEEHWYIVKLQDQKCGYMFIEMQPEGDEVRTHSLMSMQIRRGDNTIKITADQRYRETPDGRPLGFRHAMTLAEKPMTIEGAIDKGRLKVVQDQYGAKRESSYDFDPDIKFAWGLQLEQRKHGLAPGTTFTLKSYDPGIKIDGPFELTVTAVGKEPITLPGGESRTLTKVSSTMQLQGVPITTVSWVDDEANPLVMDFNMGGFAVRVLAASKEQALEGGAVPELFLNTFVKTNRKIDPAAKVVKLRLRLPKDDQSGMKMPDLPNTPAQSFERVNNHEAIVTIRRLNWEAIRKADDKASKDPAMKEYLQASPIVDINDARIKTHARRAVKNARTPAEKADALRKYVTEFVQNKALDVGFASASEVVRTRKGDCSEHAVLLAALARAAGLPARGVSGIVQIPSGSMMSSGDNSFGYHMWTQVNIDGQWVDIDAALRQTDCDPTHIALALMPLNDEGLATSVVSLLPLLGRLQIEVISVEPAQKTSGAKP